MFPVQKLYPNITADLKKYTAIHIPDALNKGLINEIEILDQDTTCSTFARICISPDKKQYNVKLSAAFSQFVWILCDIILRSADNYNISEAIKHNGGLEQLAKEYKEIESKTDAELLRIFPDFLKSLDDVERFRYQCRRNIILLGNDKLFDELEEEMNLAKLLISATGRFIDTDKYSHLDMDHTTYGGVVNGLCVKALSFVLLHELNHCYFDHFSDSTKTRIDKEKEADENAFKSMYSSAPESEKFTVGMALICQMLIGMFLSPRLIRTGSHPRPDERLFYVYDFIKQDNEKFSWALVYGFNEWAKYAGKTDSPAPLPVYDLDSVEKIRSYLQSI